ncbi:MAG: hypothetical protein AAGU11_09155, partial [Syntrophobacteraceae bacterium]
CYLWFSIEQGKSSPPEEPATGSEKRAPIAVLFVHLAHPQTRGVRSSGRGGLRLRSGTLIF